MTRITVAETGDDHRAAEGEEAARVGRKLSRKADRVSGSEAETELYLVTDAPQPGIALYIPELPDGCTVLEAALLYAQAGWYVGPIRSGVPADRKHPGSVLGKNWQHKTSRHPPQLRRWFSDAKKNYGLFLHLGRSGAVAFDGDAPEFMPEVLKEAIEADQPPYQPTRTNVSGRGHYVFVVPEGRKLGNGIGKLKSMEGKWGEVRSGNGVIVVYPSPHEKADIGGCYGPWLRPGRIPVLPESVAQLLPDKRRGRSNVPDDDSDSGLDAATDAEVVAFLSEHIHSARPGALKAVEQTFDKDIKTQSRHMSAVSATCWAMREAAAGLYPAQRAAKILRGAFIVSMKNPTQESDRVLDEGDASSEYNDIVAWAIGQVAGKSLDEVRRAALERMRRAGSKPRRLRTTRDEGQHGHAGESEEQPKAGEDSERDKTEDEESGEPEDFHLFVAAPGEPGSSFNEVDLSLVDGTSAPPTVGWMSDGRALFYMALINMIFGWIGDGKSWFALFVCQQEINQGHHVLFIDYESRDIEIKARMLAIGTDPAVLHKYFHYIHPMEPLMDHADAVTPHIERFIRHHKVTLAVIDSEGESLGMEGFKDNVGEDIVAWANLWSRPIASLGPAVLLLEHVTNDPATRGRPIGSQRKQAATEAAYGLKARKDQPFGKGRVGVTDIFCARDKQGNYVRDEAIAALTLDATVDPYALSLDPAEPQAEKGTTRWFPTETMEAMCRYVENNPDCSQIAMFGSVSVGTKTKKQAYVALTDERDKYIEWHLGPHGAHLHRCIRKYREVDHPQRDTPSGPRSWGTPDDEDEDK
jgi:hypothetical protein